jgi:hypothetical protein
MKYYMLKLKGERPIGEIEARVGAAAGTLLRVHVESGETSVYYAADPKAKPDPSKAVKAAERPIEVRLGDVTKLS